MENLCRQLGICSGVPAEWQWVVAMVMPLVVIALVAVPVAQVLHRAGHSRWWTLIAFVPLLNLIGLWVFAFARWPSTAR